MKVKTPTTIDEQISILEHKGIQIDDMDACRQFLNKVSYYRMSGYLLPLYRRRRLNNSNVTFEQVQQMYEFDSQLRSLTFQIISTIEIYLRAQLGNYHALKYGALGYYDAHCFNPKHDHRRFMRNVNDSIEERRNTSIVRHHKDKYNGQFPIWVSIEFFSTGMLAYFFRGMKNRDKSYLAESIYHVSYERLQNWLHCLTNLRNACAHNSRIYYWIFPTPPRVPREIKYTATRRFFSQIYMLKWMYPAPERWNDDVMKPLRRLIKKNRPYIDLNDMDFPRYWNAMLKV